MKAFSKITSGTALGIILIGILIVPTAAMAEEDYTLLEPSVLPGDQTSTTFENYVEQGFRTFLAVVVIIAIVMLTASGLQYIISGSGGGKGEAKTRAIAAILGLLIALSAYLILRTINPDLVDLTLDIANRGGEAGRAGVAAQSPTNPNTNNDPGGSTGNEEPIDYADGELLTEQEARDKLKDAGITVNNNTPCPEGETYQQYTNRTGGHCTSLEGIPDSAIDGAISMRDDCTEYLSSIGRNDTCSMQINAGTEAGHSNGANGHRAGNAVLDIDDTPGLQSYIVNEGTYIGKNDTTGDVYYQLNDEFIIDEGDHFHVVFDKYS